MADPMTEDEAMAAFAAAMASGGPGPMTEHGLQDAVLAECTRLGLRVFWIPRPARSGIGRAAKTARGWPDLVIAGCRGVIFRECKSRGGETSADQDDWGWYLQNGGCDWAIWRPADWESGKIQAELEAIALALQAFPWLVQIRKYGRAF
jgi:hypothetical protein